MGSYRMINKKELITFYIINSSMKFYDRPFKNKVIKN